MTYRTFKAQIAHETIIEYIKDSVSKKTVTQVINKLSFATLTETSINGHSHLIDAIHLSSVMTNNNVKEKINYLINIILKRAQSLGKEAVLFLLTTPCLGGFTPFGSLLKEAHKENLDKFLNTIHDLINKKYLTYQDYKDILFFNSQQGINALYILLRNENRENFQTYLNEIHFSIEQKIISVSDYINFFLLANQPAILHFNNLINSTNFYGLLNELNYLIERQWLTTEEFCEFIGKRDVNGYTLLHSIIKNETNIASLRLILTQLKKITKAQWLETNKLADILFAKTPRSFSIIHLAVFNNNLNVAKEVLVFLNDCVQEKLITVNHFQALYLQCNQTGLNVFASAVKTGRLENVKLFINTIQRAVTNKWLSFRICRKLFFQASNIGTTPLHLAILSGNQTILEEYFLALKVGYAQGYFKEIDIKLLFQKSDNNGHTPLYEVVQNQSLPRVKFLLEQLKGLCSINIYLNILNQKVDGNLVMCHGDKKVAVKINELLKQERELKPLDYATFITIYSSDRFFKPNIMQNKTCAEDISRYDAKKLC
ncbi:Ankyrin repeats (3 copies) [Legionella busanensis]|uniref:Ankyrin repeats (3 copies) n=1 Tax=Legionella busanensis TaxID=190655 RepID=A0A378JLV9_9GAMM|nr:ankyrin repeat domain-containing protein [Legionella busanensis]STX51070.1 Ankyrin repeats (3 copies) [Legionella busanensis]